MRFRQWALLDLEVFRQTMRSGPRVRVEYINNRDGTYGNAYFFEDFPENLIIGSEGLPIVGLDIRYIDEPLPPITIEQAAENIARANALREWHADPSIKEDFESYFSRTKLAR